MLQLRLNLCNFHILMRVFNFLLLSGWEREDSYVKLMDLREFGRFSFGGFNPDVEVY